MAATSQSLHPSGSSLPDARQSNPIIIAVHKPMILRKISQGATKENATRNHTSKETSVWRLLKRRGPDCLPHWRRNANRTSGYALLHIAIRHGSALLSAEAGGFPRRVARRLLREFNAANTHIICSPNVRIRTRPLQAGVGGIQRLSHRLASRCGPSGSSRHSSS